MRAHTPTRTRTAGGRVPVTRIDVLAVLLAGRFAGDWPRSTGGGLSHRAIRGALSVYHDGTRISC